MTPNRAAIPLVLLFIAGCPKPEPAPAEEATAADGAISGDEANAGATPEAGEMTAATDGKFQEAPHPFTAESIRAATGEGRTYTFRVEALGQPITYREMKFTDVTDEGCSIVHRHWTEGAEPVEQEAHTQTWQELWAHATYPAELTTTVEEEITVPAGTFACTRYDVLSAGSKMLATRAWFAKELPGAPVKLEAYDKGELQITSVLEKHENPGS